MCGNQENLLDISFKLCQAAFFKCGSGQETSKDSWYPENVIWCNLHIGPPANPENRFQKCTSFFSWLSFKFHFCFQAFAKINLVPQDFVFSPKRWFIVKPCLQIRSYMQCNCSWSSWIILFHPESFCKSANLSCTNKLVFDPVRDPKHCKHWDFFK